MKPGVLEGEHVCLLRRLDVIKDGEKASATSRICSRPRNRTSITENSKRHLGEEGGLIFELQY
jgi:hypothetical protein